MTRPGLLVIGAIALGTFGAAAQPPMPEGGEGRFTFHRADDGYLRLDGRTGQVSMCHRRPSGWQCQVLPDERSALETEIMRLQRDNGALKKELLTRNLPLPNGMRPDPPAAKSSGQLPHGKLDGEGSRFRQIVEDVWRRLAEFVASVQREILRRI